MPNRMRSLGWDGLILVTLALATVLVYFGRGQLGGGHQLAWVLAMDLGWWTLMSWERRLLSRARLADK